MNQACAERLEIIDSKTPATLETMKREVREGLTAERKRLPSKYFYDDRGSALFEEICHLPEYYQTRTELSILKSAAPWIMRGLTKLSLIELGSGANWKIRTLLNKAENRGSIRYVPVDVCGAALEKAAAELLELYPELAVTGIVSDFNHAMDKLNGGGQKLITFFGGTIGNLPPDDCIAFLQKISSVMNRQDRLIVGMDLVKDKKKLESAYNDARGVTAAFNKNILTVLNRELDANFDLSAFDHLAFYRDETESIEMHLSANRDCSVRIEALDVAVSIKKGETIFTEISRKFTRRSAQQTAARAGLRISRWFTDSKERFAVVEMRNGN